MLERQLDFMLYKMNTCLGGKWDKAYDAEMFTCLTSSANVQDMDAMAAYPSDMPDFSGSAGNGQRREATLGGSAKATL